MNVLICGLTLFFMAFFIHLIVWKIHLPKNHTKAILLIFILTLICGIFILRKLPVNIYFFGAPQTVYEYLQISLLFISLMSAYIATYPGIEVDSPSLVMVAEIAVMGGKGLDKDIFEQKINNNQLVTRRLDDLVAGRMVSYDNGIYKLTRKGATIARIFIEYRKLLRKNYKGG